MDDATREIATWGRLAGVEGVRAERGQSRLTVMLVVVLASGLVALLSGALWVLREEAPASPPTTARRSAASPSAPVGPSAPLIPPGLAILRAWDSRRAAAWARGDTGTLRTLYVPGSATGRRDVAMLRVYTGRGLVVRGLRQQVLGIGVLQQTDSRLRLRVTERLLSATAVGPGVRRALPAGQAARHLVDLRLEGGSWRVVEVRAA